MSRWMVYTDAGDYEVYAATAEAAMRKVYFLTYGRARDMHAVRA